MDTRLRWSPSTIVPQYRHLRLHLGSVDRQTVGSTRGKADRQSRPALGNIGKADASNLAPSTTRGVRLPVRSLQVGFRGNRRNCCRGDKSNCGQRGPKERLESAQTAHGILTPTRGKLQPRSGFTAASEVGYEIGILKPIQTLNKLTKF